MAPKAAKAAPPEASQRPWLEFCVAGPAVSFRAKKKQLLAVWKQKVGAAALAARPDGIVATASFFVAITEFSERATKDRDNLAKPILDAMQGVAYVNDIQVLQLYVDWSDIRGAYVVRFMSPVVAAALSKGDEFLWIRIALCVPRRDLIR